ncbi:ATP-dependent DNA helicase [Sneathiella chungangensis]|uniref:ATP-dependent DNA helicase n=1 Tax=Sneathiella chungangensis TaxID=1418234 RepID=A0A845MH31_9PROT|nr:ATP-dependent DNA helicase [Sneathiella chungangensis]MZR23333.1 ATP-dependent DNA helicase [Sneathiella chungangensis]
MADNHDSTTENRRVLLPDAPVLVLGGDGGYWLTPDGEVAKTSVQQTAARVVDAPPLLIHRLNYARRLGINPFPAFDLLELYAFAFPARHCLPTARGLARALNLSPPGNPEEQTLLFFEATNSILKFLTGLNGKNRKEASAIAMTMGQAGWNWAPAVLAALGLPESRDRYGGLDAWRALPEWPDYAPEPPPDDIAVSEFEARERLKEMLGDNAESRPQQADFSALASHAFLPRDQADAPNLVLAEAGTGTGKTLGYIAPASIWAEKNGAAVWISTYTKNLQRQIDDELNRLYHDPAEKSEKAVVRKGRENYLCLLNFEEALQGGAAARTEQITLGLIARWISATRDGDMVGGDFPSWLLELEGRSRITRLADRRGECIYSACPHYRKCFIEKSGRKARKADIVIANHALVMINGATRPDDPFLPRRYVFDEGHHLFDAADSAFSAHLTGQETAELRRWVAGNDTGRKSRMRGLENRIGDLIGDDEAGAEALQKAIRAARKLPSDGWLARVRDGAPNGPMEEFLALIRTQVLARCKQPDSPYSIECAIGEVIPRLPEAADRLNKALGALSTPMATLGKVLITRLDEEAEDLDSTTRFRIEAAVQGISRRVSLNIAPWRSMLKDIEEPTPDGFVDWFAIDRLAGRDMDLGFYRSYIDPTKPFADVILKPAHGVVVTSATLRDNYEETESWQSADMRTGAHHMVLPPLRAHLASPFDFAAQTRIVVVTDVRRDHMKEVSAAYRELFLASGGGALGLFTAIWRLRAVHENIKAPLAAAGFDLYAQHQDALDTSTLVDIFREEENSILLGTDAVRDGVDVPGRSLRLLVFDRIPWPRPDIKHKARKKAFGGSKYDDKLTRLKLKQAYGRLLRRENDFGVFVMLDSMLPSRLASAFPPEVEIHRVGLKEAIALTRNFIAEKEQVLRKISLD